MVLGAFMRRTSSWRVAIVVGSVASVAACVRVSGGSGGSANAAANGGIGNGNGSPGGGGVGGGTGAGANRGPGGYGSMGQLRGLARARMGVSAPMERAGPAGMVAAVLLGAAPAKASTGGECLLEGSRALRWAQAVRGWAAGFCCVSCREVLARRARTAAADSAPMGNAITRSPVGAAAASPTAVPGTPVLAIPAPEPAAWRTTASATRTPTAAAASAPAANATAPERVRAALSTTAQQRATAVGCAVPRPVKPVRRAELLRRWHLHGWTVLRVGRSGLRQRADCCSAT